MIRRGKSEGWLQIPSDAMLSWAKLNGVEFHRTRPGLIPGRGAALLADQDLDAASDDSNILLTVPKDLILSLERCQEHAKVDRDYRELLESLGDFGRTPRGAILCFLLVQASMSCPELPRPHHSGIWSSLGRCDLSSSLIDHERILLIIDSYIKSLPMELLPTFWTESEFQLLVGTTLMPAVSAKLKSLQREYDLICSNATHTRWYQTVQDHLDFDDWLQVDAMYRSRALDFPQIGHCMAPCIDVANHASGDSTIAVYEKDFDGNAVLLLRDTKKVDASEEVTITYGDEKGACEMVFSYGFLEDGMQSAETLFLSLSIPTNDSLRTAKLEFADCAPGFKLVDVGQGEIGWDGDFIWLLCVTEDDGFGFEIARTVDGGEEMVAFFQEQALNGGAAELRRLLGESELWDVYRLRAVALLQSRVFDQLQLLYTTQDDIDATPHGERMDVRDVPYQLSAKLRTLEFDLMNQAYEVFEQQKIQLAESPVVVRYLEKMSENVPATITIQSDIGDTNDDDFS